MREPVVPPVFGDLRLLAAVPLHAPNLHQAGVCSVIPNVLSVRGILRAVVKATLCQSLFHAAVHRDRVHVHFLPAVDVAESAVGHLRAVRRPAVQKTRAVRRHQTRLTAFHRHDINTGSKVSVVKRHVADRKLRFVRGDHMVVVALVAAAGVEQPFRVRVEVIGIHVPLGVIKNGIAVFQPVRCLYHAVKTCHCAHRAGLHVVNIQKAHRIFSVLGKPVQHLTNFLKLARHIGAKVLLVDKLRNVPTLGKTEARGKVHVARAHRHVDRLAARTEILVVHGLHPRRVALQKCDRVFSAKLHPAHVRLCAYLAHAKVKQVFIRRLARDFRLYIPGLIVQQQPNAERLQHICRFHVVQRRLLQDAFCTVLRRFHHKLLQPGLLRNRLQLIHRLYQILRKNMD